MQVGAIGVDLAKTAFQVHGIDPAWFKQTNPVEAAHDKQEH
jgi:hypothetical protein